MKVTEAKKRFIDYLQNEKRRAALTVTTYGIVLDDFESFLERNDISDISEVGAREIREWQMEHSEQGEKATTIAKKISILRSWFSYLRKEKLYDADVMAKITSPKKPKHLPIFFKEKEVEKIYDTGLFPNTFEGERDKLILRILYETGVRRSELVGLKESDIDTSRHILKVLGKRNKERFIPIENELEQNIKRYIALKEEIENRDDALFINARGKAIGAANVYTIVKKYMSTVSQADRISPHVFRHTFATLMLNEGADIDAIKELLGHASLNATEIYTHVTREHLKETYRHSHPRAKKKSTEKPIITQQKEDL